MTVDTEVDLSWSSTRKPNYIEDKSTEKLSDCIKVLAHLVNVHRTASSRSQRLAAWKALNWWQDCCFGNGFVFNGSQIGNLHSFIGWKVTSVDGPATLLALQSLAREADSRLAAVGQTDNNKAANQNEATRACYAILAIAQLGLMKYVRDDLKPYKVISASFLCCSHICN